MIALTILAFSASLTRGGPTMTPIRRTLVLSTAVALLAMLVGPKNAVAAGAQTTDPRLHVTEAITSYGGADWTKGVITATGRGFPPKEAVNAEHSRLMAKRAAHG